MESFDVIEWLEDGLKKDKCLFLIDSVLLDRVRCYGYLLVVSLYL